MRQRRACMRSQGANQCARQYGRRGTSDGNAALRKRGSFHKNGMNKACPASASPLTLDGVMSRTSSTRHRLVGRYPGLVDCDLQDLPRCVHPVAVICKRVCSFQACENFKPSTDRCGGSAGSKSGDFFRFPLNCRAELHSEHQPLHSKPLSKCHCHATSVAVASQNSLAKSSKLNVESKT